MTNQIQATSRDIDTSPLPRIVVLCVSVGVVAACALYFWRLHDTPMAIGGDEAFTANHGLALATTGRDLNGRLLPLLIQVEPNMDPGLWWQSFLIYMEALVFLVLPFAEWSARLPVALLAVGSVLLTGMAAARHARDTAAGIVAAMVLAMSPTFFVLSRQALDYMCPAAFVAAWLYLIARLARFAEPRVAFACGVVLGIGLFSHVSAWLMMPMYLVCTCGACAVKGGLRLCVAAVAGFALPAAALMATILAHPSALANLINLYAGGAGYLPGLNINTYYRFADLVSGYWIAWNPAQLFFIGSPNPTIGVRTGGVFVWPVAILFVAGLVSLRARTFDMVLLAGLLLAPVGPVLYGTPTTIQRQLVLLPIVAVVSGLGAQWLSHHSRLARRVAIVSLLMCPVFFSYVVYTVFATREDSVRRHDPSNFRELTPSLADLNRQLEAAQVVLAIGPSDRRAYWRFHTNKLGETALQGKAVFWEPGAFDAAAIAPNSLIVAAAPSALAEQLDRSCPRVAAVKGDSDIVVWRATAARCAAEP